MMNFDKISFEEATKVEKFGMVESIVLDNVKDTDLSKVISDFLEKEIDMITKKYEKSKNSENSKKNTQAKENIDYILGIMTDTSKVYHKEDFVNENFSAQKLVSYMSKLIKSEKVIKIGTSKENKTIGYQLAAISE